MKLSILNEKEVDYLLHNCNFTEIEKEVFILRAKGKNLTEISVKTNYSLDGIKKISRKVNNKIIRSKSP